MSQASFAERKTALVLEVNKLKAQINAIARKPARTHKAMEVERGMVATIERKVLRLGKNIEAMHVEYVARTK